MEFSPPTPSPHTYTLTVEPENEGLRIDKFLSRALPAYSRSFFQQCIENGTVTINNVLPKPSALVRAGDLVAVKITPFSPILAKGPLDDMGIEIVFCHEHFLILYKPAHILVHRTQKPSHEPTLVDWLLAHYKEIEAIGSPERPGIVHRLDKETSGLLIVARTNFAHKILSELFKNKQITKTYVALVEGHPPASGTIQLEIGRDPVHRKKMAAFAPASISSLSGTGQRNNKPKTTRNACTHYKVLEYFNEYSLVEVYPQTGRTHQIRVHFSSIGHPLVGDYLYGTPSSLINRHALHAQSLAFDFQGEHFSLSKEIPADFKSALEHLRTT